MLTILLEVLNRYSLQHLIPFNLLDCRVLLVADIQMLVERIESDSLLVHVLITSFGEPHIPDIHDLPLLIKGDIKDIISGTRKFISDQRIPTSLDMRDTAIISWWDTRKIFLFVHLYRLRDISVLYGTIPYDRVHFVRPVRINDNLRQLHIKFNLLILSKCRER